MNRRKFLSYVSCGCGSLLLSSCTSAPITERKQLKIVSEAKLNAQAAQIYEKIKEKEKMSDDTKTLNEIKNIKCFKCNQDDKIKIEDIFKNGSLGLWSTILGQRVQCCRFFYFNKH